MNTEPAVTTYLISEPFDRGLRAVREGLSSSGLSISTELDVCGRVKRELNLGLAPCRILFVDSPRVLLEAVTLDRAAAALLPLHVVVSGTGSQTLVHWVTLATIEGVRLPTGAAVPLAKLQSLLSRALERIAMRQDLCQTASYGR
jgi:uncharacterized protein (DUF302 family)